MILSDVWQQTGENAPQTLDMDDSRLFNADVKFFDYVALSMNF